MKLIVEQARRRISGHGFLNLISKLMSGSNPGGDLCQAGTASDEFALISQNPQLWTAIA
jgi:hypothetical protein